MTVRVFYIAKGTGMQQPFAETPQPPFHTDCVNMDFNLKNVLQALLFSTSEPLSIKDIQAVITRYHQENDTEADAEGPDGDEGSAPPPAGQGVMREIVSQVPSLLTASQIRDAMDAIVDELEQRGDVYRLLHGPHGYRIVVDARYAEWVRLLRKEPRPQRLSQAALETLAIVSYRQPVTRAEIEAIRGVSADSALSRLLEHELVAVVGRADLPGRPIQYGTTDQFLEFVGIRSTEELPASDVLSPNQISDWIRRATHPEELTDKDMGLSEESPELEEPELSLN